MKRALLWAVIVSLVLSAFAAIGVFIFGEYNEIQTKILFSAFITAFYSLMGLSGAALWEKRHHVRLAVTCVFFAFLGYIIALSQIWFLIVSSFWWQCVFGTLVSSFTLAHICLVLLPAARKNFVRIWIGGTIFFILCMALILEYMIFAEFNIDTYVYRMLGVSAVLNVFGTITIPIVRKLQDGV